MSNEQKPGKTKTPALPPCQADKELEYLIKAKYNIIYAVTWEEWRVIYSLEQICDLPDVNIGGVQVWDAAKGLVTSRGVPIEGGLAFASNPDLVLDYIMRRAEESKASQLTGKENRGPIFVLCDAFRYLDPVDPRFERKLRSLSESLKKTSISIIIISPVLTLPLALEKVVTVLDYPLPGIEQLDVIVKTAKARLVERKRITQEDADSTPDEKVVHALLGLTMNEAEDAIAKAVVVTRKFDIPTLLELKKQIIRKGQILEYVYSDETLENIGGLDGIKQWIKIRKKSFTDKAKEYGLPSPKGIFLMGVQGCGKSLSAKAIANELQVPLLKFDIGRVFGSLVGESEARMRQSLKLAESIAPCVLLIDEIGKALSGAGSSNDGGTTQRVLMTMLDWMQEKTAPVFIVACSNELRLDPALLRRGRFDELFFVDLPQEKERFSIFEIHIRKRNRDPNNYDIKKLVEVSNGFSGAEIEACIIEAMNNAFSDNREFDTNDVLDAVGICVPLSTVMKTQLDALREESRGRMRLAHKLYIKGEAQEKENVTRFDFIREQLEPPRSLGEDILE